MGVAGNFLGNAASKDGGCLMAVRSKLNIKSNSLFQSNSGRYAVLRGPPQPPDHKHMLLLGLYCVCSR